MVLATLYYHWKQVLSVLEHSLLSLCLVQVLGWTVWLPNLAATGHTQTEHTKVVGTKISKVVVVL